MWFGAWSCGFWLRRYGGRSWFRNHLRNTQLSGAGLLYHIWLLVHWCLQLLLRWFFTVILMPMTFASSFFFPYYSSLYLVLRLEQGGLEVIRSNMFLQKKKRGINMKNQIGKIKHKQIMISQGTYWLISGQMPWQGCWGVIWSNMFLQKKIEESTWRTKLAKSNTNKQR